MQSFVTINGVRTNILTYGRWIEESPENNGEEAEDIVLVIPGNPGITGFYKIFLQTIHDKLGYPVWIVGHAGHEIPKNDELPGWKNNRELYSLEGQIKHKLEFIEKYVPKNARLHLIGHSIGSYISLELMKYDSIKSRVVDINCLFSTIEYMAETPNGKFLLNYTKPILWLILFLSFIYSILPLFLQIFLMYIYRKIAGIPRMHMRPLIHLINPIILNNVFQMAFDEMDHVRERNNRILKDYVKIIKFYYSNNDNWAPLTYADKLKNEISDVCVKIVNFDHTFVMTQSREVANLVVDSIKAN